LGVRRVKDRGRECLRKCVCKRDFVCVWYREIVWVSVCVWERERENESEMGLLSLLPPLSLCVCVCVCVWERERKIVRAFVCVCIRECESEMGLLVSSLSLTSLPFFHHRSNACVCLVGSELLFCWVLQHFRR